MEINKLIGYGIGIIVIYYIAGAFIGYIIVAVVGMVIWRVYQELRRF
jgi:hypothetical protein